MRGFSQGKNNRHVGGLVTGVMASLTQLLCIAKKSWGSVHRAEWLGNCFGVRNSLVNTDAIRASSCRGGFALGPPRVKHFELSRRSPRGIWTQRHGPPGTQVRSNASFLWTAVATI